MPEQKMSYEERVDSMANRLAKAEGLKKETFFEGQWNAILERFKIYAKEAVAMQAEAIREALTYSFSSFIYALQPLSADDMKQRINLYLLEHGYIEPKNEGDGKK